MEVLNITTEDRTGWDNLCPEAEYCEGVKDSYYFNNYCKDNKPGCFIGALEKLKNITSKL